MPTDRSDANYAKIARRRAGICVLWALLAAGAALAMAFSTGHNRRSIRAGYKLTRNALALLELSGRIETRCQVALARIESERGEVFGAILRELADESHEEAVRLGEGLAAAGLDGHRRELLDEMDEVQAAVAQLSAGEGLRPSALADCAYRAATLREIVPEFSAEGLTALAHASSRNRIVWRAALGAALLAFGGALVSALSTVLGMLEGLIGPMSLEDELRALEEHPHFRYRVQRLASGPPGGHDEQRWSLSVEEVIKHHRTHTTFRAIAARGDQRLRLWGKAYTWAGWLKGLQRLVAPAYAQVTWEALERMRSCGLVPC